MKTCTLQGEIQSSLITAASLRGLHTGLLRGAQRTALMKENLMGFNVAGGNGAAEIWF